MTQTTQSLIVSTGQLDNERNWFGFRKTPLKLPDVEYGQRLVLLDGTGEAVTADTVSGGERAFGQFRSWVLVDVRSQELVLEYDNLLSTTYARYLIAVHLQANVADAGKLVLSGISSLESFCRPKVAAAAKSVLRRAEFPDGKLADRVNQIRAMAEDSLHQGMVAKSDLLDLPAWLELSVTDVSVHNDADAETHLTELRRHVNRNDVIVASGKNELTRTELDMQRRRLVREELGQHMSNSSVTLLESVWDDPSPENIRVASLRMREKEVDEQAFFLRVVDAVNKSGTVMDDEGLLRVVRQLVDAGRGELPVIEATAETVDEHAEPIAGGQASESGPEAPGSESDPAAEAKTPGSDSSEERRAGHDVDDADFTNR